MRRLLIAGNWKMNLTPAEARALIAALRAELEPDGPALARDRDVMVAPAAALLSIVAEALAGSPIQLGAQNMYFEERGAFTGEVSPLMLKSLAVRYVIVGHSERRHIFGEDDGLINKKVRAAIAHELVPVFCVGEDLKQREDGITLKVVLGQLAAGLEGVQPTDARNVVVAYEPVWAIGTGRNATPQQAQDVHGALRQALAKRFGEELGEQIRLLSGGSVTADNIDALVREPDIDGALVGGASLKADSFARIVRARAI